MTDHGGDEYPLAGRVAIVTGSSRGMGQAMAEALAKAGADVAVNYRQRAAEANAVASTINDLGRRSVAGRQPPSVAVTLATNAYMTGQTISLNGGMYYTS